MDAKAKQWLVAACAFVGIGLVVAGTVLGQRYLPTWVVGLGFALVIVGYIGLMVLSRQARLRKVGGAGAASASATPGVPLPSTWEMPVPSAQDGLTAPVRFDLTHELEAYRKRMRSALVMRYVLYAFLMVLGAVALGVGLWRRDPAGSAFGVLLLIFGSALALVARTVARAPVEMTISPEGLAFRLEPPLSVDLRWDDPRFGAKVTVASAEVNHAIDPARTAATYRFFTGSGSGMGHGPRVLTDIPPDCFTLLLREARLHGLRLSERVSGVAGTVSERRIYQINR